MQKLAESSPEDRTANEEVLREELVVSEKEFTEVQELAKKLFTELDKECLASAKLDKKSLQTAIEAIEELNKLKTELQEAHKSKKKKAGS